MSRFDALPADQKAVLQLLLRQGKGYEDLAGLLRLEPAAVRSRAYDALDALGPGAGGVHTERRRTVSDWLLGQQGPEDAAATLEYLEGSSAARAWATAVARELEPTAGDRLPGLPGEATATAPNGRVGAAEAAAAGATAASAAGAGAGADATPAAPDASTDEKPQSPAAAGASVQATPPTATGEASPSTPLVPAPSSKPRVSRRGGAILIGGVLAAIAAVVLVIVLAGGGGSGGSDPGTTDAAATTTTQPRVTAQVNLFPPKGAPAKRALGVVQVVDVGGQQAINAVVQGLPPTTKSGYGIWLYASPSNEKWLGYFQSADRQGRAIAQGALPDDVSQYREMLVSRESRRDPPRPGVIFLRGTIGPPPSSAKGTSTGTGTGG